MTDSEPDRWVGMIVRFFFGAIFGLFAGISIWAFVLGDVQKGWLAIPISTCVVGIVAAIWGDRFWTEGINWFSGWW